MRETGSTLIGCEGGAAIPPACNYDLADELAIHIRMLRTLAQLSNNSNARHLHIISRVRIKTFFWDRQMFLSFFAFFAFFAFLWPSLVFYCPRWRSFASSSVILGVSRIVARLHPALICCAPAARQLGSETRPLPMHDALITRSVSPLSAVRFRHTRS
jgi:hypothetical protein